MKKIARINTHTTDIVECSAKDYWYYLVDRWEDYPKWLTAAGQTLTVLSCELAPFSRPGVLPRTRIIHLDNPGDEVHWLTETLIYANPETMTMFYRVDGIGTDGMRNYIAIQTIDELEDGKCRVTISAHYDTEMLDKAEKAEGETKWFHNAIIHYGAESCRFLAEQKAKEGEKA